MSYADLLNEKEWLIKCNEILNRDNYKCHDCGCLGYHNGGNYLKLNNLEEVDVLFKA